MAQATNLGSRLLSVTTAHTNSFRELTTLGGLNPAVSFQYANLVDVDFGDDDLEGFDFYCANLHGANLERARNLHLANFKNAIVSRTTKGVFRLPAQSGAVLLEEDKPPAQQDSYSSSRPGSTLSQSGGGAIALEISSKTTSEFQFIVSEAESVGKQLTLRSSVRCSGTGLHCGLPVSVSLLPAPSNTGIVFRRTDLPADLVVDILARYDNVINTRLTTVLGLPNHSSASVGGVEHLLAVLCAYNIYNVIVEVSGPELPVLDGSAEPWAFLVECAGIAALRDPAQYIEILKDVRVEDGEAFVEFRPNTTESLELSLAIDFSAEAIGRQSLTLRLDKDSFQEIARARSFCLESEIAALRTAGLAQGGTLDNTVVVDGEHLLNPGGLRMNDEFVRHKLFDAVGDLALAGAGLRGRFCGYRSGHSLNNKALRALFADATNWRLVQGGSTPSREAAAA